MKRLRNIALLNSDVAGQTTVEWTLLLCVFGIPMVVVLSWLLASLAEYYRMVTFLIALPFP